MDKIINQLLQTVTSDHINAIIQGGQLFILVIICLIIGYNLVKFYVNHLNTKLEYEDKNNRERYAREDTTRKLAEELSDTLRVVKNELIEEKRLRELDNESQSMTCMEHKLKIKKHVETAKNHIDNILENEDVDKQKILNKLQKAKQELEEAIKEVS